MESAPQTRPAVPPKPIAPPRLKKQAEKPEKRPPPQIAPYSGHQLGTSPQPAPRPAPRSNGASNHHSISVATVEDTRQRSTSPQPPPKPARRSAAKKRVDNPPPPRSEGRSEEGGGSEGPGVGNPPSPRSEEKSEDGGGSEGPGVGNPPSPRSEEKSEEGGGSEGPGVGNPAPPRSEEEGGSEGPAGHNTADAGHRVSNTGSYIEMEVCESPSRGESPSHLKMDTQIVSLRDPSPHPPLDSTHSSIDSARLSIGSAHSSIGSAHSSIGSAHLSIGSAHSSNDSAHPPVERRRRPPPPAPPQRQVDRLEGNLLNQAQSALTDPAVDHKEQTPQSTSMQPSSPSSAVASKPSPSGATHPGNTEKGDSKGTPPLASPLPNSAVVEQQSTASRPRRRPPPPPVQPFSSQPRIPSVSSDPLHRKRVGSNASLTRSKSLPRPRMRSNQSTDSKYNTLQSGTRSGSLRYGNEYVSSPTAEKEKKKGKLQLPGWLKKLSGSPSPKRKTHDINSGSSVATKKGSTKRGKFSSSRSCDDKLAEAIDTDDYAPVDVTQPVTPSSVDVTQPVTPSIPVTESYAATAADMPTSVDTDAYSTVDYPNTTTALDTQTPEAPPPVDQPAPAKPQPYVEPVYAAVYKPAPKKKVSAEAPAAPRDSSPSAYEEVVVERRVGSKVVRQSSKLRLSRALSAESFNLEDFDEEEALQMWGGRVVSPVHEAEGSEHSGGYATIAATLGGGVSLQQDEGVSLQQDEGMSLQQDEGVTLQQDEGVSFQQDEGVSLQQDEGVSLQQDEGVSLPQDEGVSLQQGEGVSTPRATKRAPPPVPLPYAQYKQQLAAQMGAATNKACTLSSLTTSSPAHSPPGSRSAPGTLRGSNPSQQRWSSSSGGGPVVVLNPEDEEDDTDWEGDSDEDDYEDPGVERPKTYQIAKEILKTERTFVQRLTLLDQDFRGTIDSYNRSHDRPVVTEETMKHILSNVGSLRLLNTDFLSKLELRFKNWDACPRIGDIMSGFAPYLKMYSEYISKFDRSLRVLDETMKRNPVFYEMVKEFEAQPRCANLSVANYMLETVQRIPRYKLLLQDYIKHLPEDSEDTEESKKALDVIARVAQDVNESMRQMDNFRKLVEIEKKLVGDVGGSLITPTRKLLKEGEVSKFSRKERTPRMFFLFTDILLYATTAQPPSFTSYKVIRRIPLLGLRIEDLDDPEVKHGFQIISTTKSFRLEASSEEDKKQWLKLTQQAIQELEEVESSRKKRRRTYSICIDGDVNTDAPLGQYAPPWLPDSCVSMCMSCTINFTMTRRRHHCRACGNVFCHHCTCFEGALKYKDNKMERVCQTCYETLKQLGVNVKMAKQSKMASSSSSSSRVLQEVKARDQNSERSGYLLIKGKRGWKRRWFVLSNLALYSFAKHEDRAAKKSIIVPSHQLVYPFEEDPLQFCLTTHWNWDHRIKGEDVEDVERWVEVLQLASRGESSI